MSLLPGISIGGCTFQRNMQATRSLMRHILCRAMIQNMFVYCSVALSSRLSASDIYSRTYKSGEAAEESVLLTYQRRLLADRTCPRVD
jgi:hypothetical protein